MIGIWRPDLDCRESQLYSCPDCRAPPRQRTRHHAHAAPESCRTRLPLRVGFRIAIGLHLEKFCGFRVLLNLLLIDVARYCPLLNVKNGPAMDRQKSGRTRRGRILPAKDRSISAAPFYGSSKEAEYRIEGNPGLVLIVFPPGARRCYYSRTVDGHRRRRKVRLGNYSAKPTRTRTAR
jgi:hypothetical protein